MEAQSLATLVNVPVRKGDREGLRAVSRAFSFPFPEAYLIQIDLMQAIFRTIEEGKVGLFESPTGTGKSLSLICAAFTWLTSHSEREMQGNENTKIGDDPDWVVVHDIKKRREELLRREEDLQERIRSARKRLKAAEGTSSNANKRSKSSVNKAIRDTDEDSDSDYLVQDPVEDSLAQGGDSAYLSPAVRALMEQMKPIASKEKQRKPYYATRKGQDGEEDEDVEPETSPKVIYASRTHSQLSQFISELKKTSFGKDIEVKAIQQDGRTMKMNTRSVSLGSRKQMCINPSVQELGQRAGMEAMNERCVELMKQGSESATKKAKRCQYLPLPDSSGEARLLDFRDKVFTKVRDIEDIVELGRDQHICPYFGARSSARQAQLITLPYNLLLQANARTSLNIDLKESIIIIDEAHNLIDTILSIHTVIITSAQVKQAQHQINEYLGRFSTKLKGSNEVNLKKLSKLLDRLHDECKEQEKKLEGSKNVEEIITGIDLVRRMGGNTDQINLVDLEHWLKESQIARKVAGYAEKKSKECREANVSSTRMTQSALSAMHSIEAFLLSLANRSDDGRVFLALTRDENTSTGFTQSLTLKYQLLNPADVFSDLVGQARSIILAGGTMEPISDFTNQLFPTLTTDQLTHFSCNHVIPPENLLTAVISKGPRGSDLQFKFDARSDKEMLDELTNCIASYCSVVPHGVVVFLPSYAFLDALTLRWRVSQGVQRIASKKAVFYEPKLASEVDSVLREYTLANSNNTGGAILFAVVGAKLSEGINFSDRLARAVIMVGMPFANSTSPELMERMKYVRVLSKNDGGASANESSKKVGSTTDPGQELYINLCMKAVNQSIGRAIRHESDFAALILLDLRYGRADIQNRLPAWIRPSVKRYETFGPSIAALGAFFRDKKSKGVL
ncbi:hypothetical protein CBS101457_001543 [Exobasidium rhododendri]|nr:hypothetical protein CBS101457_001543 [Exobasidium rhododendri]